MSEVIDLADFLSPDFDKLPVRLAVGIESTPELSSLKALLLMKFSAAQWASLLPVLAGKVKELLQVPLTGILARAWKDLNDVRKAMETTRQSAERTEVVTLADHTIESEHKPYLDLYENGKQIGRITFSLSLEIELHAVMLEIEKGAVRKVGSGDVRMKGTLKVGEFTLLEKAFEPVRLPGEIRFGETTAGPAG